MKHIEILLIFSALGIVIGIISKRNLLKRHLLYLSFALLLAYAILKPNFTLAIIAILGICIITFYILKVFKKKISIKMLEVEYDNNYIQEFINNYKKDIYSYFPFYQTKDEQRCFLTFLNTDLAGIFIAKKVKKDLIIEVDYVKPSYRNKTIGNYFYKQNTGYFKKLGVNRLITKSYHKGHSKFLKKMGFEQHFINNEMFFIKNLD